MARRTRYKKFSREPTNIREQLKAKGAEVWKLEEASGTRVGSLLGIDLSDNSTVNQSDGIDGSCAQFDGTGTNDYLSRLDEAAVQPTDRFGLAMWINADAMSSNQDIVEKGRAAPEESFIIRLQSTGRVQIFLSELGTTFTQLRVDQPRLDSLNTWYFLVFNYKGFEAVNSDRFQTWYDGVPVTSYDAFPTVPTSLNSSTEEFRIPTIDFPFNGMIDEVVWLVNNNFTQEEIDWMYDKQVVVV